jgi:hypothetical protein
MENTKETQKSKPVSFLLLIPSLLLGIISLALAIVGLGMIPLLPAAAGIVLGVISYFVFRGSYVTFTKIVIGVSIVAALMSVFRSTLIKGKVTEDQSFDSTMVNTQQGIDSDLEDAFSSDSTELQ